MFFFHIRVTQTTNLQLTKNNTYLFPAELRLVDEKDSLG